MRTRILAFAPVLAIAAAAAAEPPKADSVKAPPAQAPRRIALASAKDLRVEVPASVQAASAPTKRPAPRLTSCRCGDPQPDEQSPEN